MATTPVRESPRYAFPPLWLVPLLLIGVIIAIVYVSLALSLAGLVVAAYAVWWLERWADAYVRERDTD
jgi:small-conductance mechanosensitive channel